MGTDFNVFISWSGNRSRLVAQALYEWLPMVLQAAKPWMSESDIDKGSRSLREISKALAGAKFGISCLTPENLQAPWLLYEAGALSKAVEEHARLWTYLFAGLRPEDVTGPLSQFQATRANRDDTQKLLQSINRALSATPVPDNALEVLFEAMWPKLEEQLRGIPEPQQQTSTKRSAEEMVAEILVWTRAETRRREVDQWVEAAHRRYDTAHEKARSLQRILRQQPGLPEQASRTEPPSSAEAKDVQD